MRNSILLLIALCLSFSSQYADSQWQTFQTPTNIYFKDISVVDQNVIWACGTQGTVVKTINGGTNWVVYTVGLTGQNLNIIRALSANEAWVAGGSSGRIFKTTNGGMNWFEQIYANPKWIDGLKFFNSSVGVFISGPNANNQPADFYVTRNGGLNWTRSPNSQISSMLNENCFGAIDTNFVWFTDDNKFYKLSNGLYNVWEVSTIDTLNPYLLVSHFFNRDTGFVGDGGIGTDGFVLYSTTNSGLNWSIYSRDAEGMSLLSLKFVPNTSFVFVNGVNEFRISTNGGINWHYRKEYSNSDSMNFYFMDAFDSNSVWLTNSKGRLLKYNISCIGISQISTEIPSGYNLHQNYPNPFNPSTSIRIDLPISGEISFTVYDLLGKSVYEMSEYKSAGSYEINFDGSALASGIYLYRLNSGTYSISKKMILLK